MSIFWTVVYLILGVLVAYPLGGNLKVRQWKSPRLLVVFIWPLVFLVVGVGFILGYGHLEINGRTKYKGVNR